MADPITVTLSKPIQHDGQIYETLTFREATAGDFADAEAECAALLERGLALPAYDQCIKASHRFNLLDARGVISVAERAAYIGRVRTLAKACCEAWLAAELEAA